MGRLVRYDRFILVVIGFWGLAVLVGCGGRRVQEYMRPYDKLAAMHATEREAVRQLGPPNKVLRSDSSLADMAKRFKPYRRTMPQHVERKVLIYYADPWNDAEGYVVYVFIDRQGRVASAVFGG
jgi:hypothetical protein